MTKERCAGIRDRLRNRAHSPPLPSILLANVQSLENKMDDLRARTSFQRDIRQGSRQKKSSKEPLAPIRKKRRCQIIFLGATE